MYELLSQGLSWFGIGFAVGGFVVAYSVMCFARFDKKGQNKDEN